MSISYISVKVLDKRHIVHEKKTQYVKREKEVLLKIDHPFFIKLHFTFQDEDRLCIRFINSAVSRYLFVSEQW